MTDADQSGAAVVRSKISRLLGGECSDDPDPSAGRVDDRQQRSKEHLDEYGEEARTLVYCELCQQVFTTFDVFYDHRMASEHEVAREKYETPGDVRGWQFGDYQELKAGDEFPADATVGDTTPCEPLPGDADAE